MSLHTLHTTIRRDLVKLGVAAILAAGSASASVVGIYGGIDTGTGPGGPFPNSTAAEAAFWTALSVSGPTVTFEGVANLASLGSGASASIINGDPMSGLQFTDQHTPEPLGFNITAGGNEWLRVVPLFNSSGASVMFNFSSAINAFGAWFTDTQSNFPGPITITFNDGTSEIVPVPKNGADGSGAFSGGAEFFGFVTDAPFTSVTINTGATDGTRDAWGLDNLTFGDPEITATPEPSTLSLLACAALLVISLKFRGTNVRPALQTIETAPGRNRG